jgi:hypothetical protein
VSSVVNAADILGGIISHIDEKFCDQTNSDDGEYCDITFYTIVTDKGRADVILHVDHNGYYGGNLESPVLTNEIPASALTPE